MKGPALELIVLEGGGKHSRFLLNQFHYLLGRLDPGESHVDGKLLFPEPTVSKVHAELAWDEAKNRYLLIHRSQTNATLVNGSRVTRARHLNPGDRLAMGRLVLEIRIGIGQHTQADIAEVDVAALTRAASATAPEIVTWVANTPVSRPAPVAPMPSRIPPPPRKPWPMPAFEHPYNPLPVDPAALAAPADWERAQPVEAEEEMVSVDLSPRRIVLEPVQPDSADVLGESAEEPDFGAEEIAPAEEVTAAEEITAVEDIAAVEQVAVVEEVAAVAVEPAQANEMVVGSFAQANEMVVGSFAQANKMIVGAFAQAPPEQTAPASPPKPKPYVRASRKIGRNEPCPCGSGKKFKKCCLS